MAKFVVLAREAFTDLVRGLKSSAHKPTGKRSTEVSTRLLVFNKRRDAIQRRYQEATGKKLPESKIAVPKDLYERLKSLSIIKKYDQNDLEFGLTTGASQPKKGFGAPAARRRAERRLNPDFRSGEQYLRQRQSEEGY